MSGASSGQAFRALVVRDIAMAARQGAGGLQTVIFFAIVVTLVPIGLGPDLALLTLIAPGMLWVALILASLLTLDRMFQADFEDGSFDVMTLSALPLEGLVLAKCLAHWLTNALPLILVSPILALLLNMDGAAFAMLIVTLLIGTPAVILIGAIGGALTVGVRRAGLLIGLLAMPLYVPVIIFATGAVAAAVRGADAGAPMTFSEPNLLFLGAMSLFSLVLGPLAAAAGLRANLS